MSVKARRALQVLIQPRAYPAGHSDAHDVMLTGDWAVVRIQSYGASHDPQLSGNLNLQKVRSLQDNTSLLVAHTLIASGNTLPDTPRGVLYCPLHFFPRNQIKINPRTWV